MPQCHQLCTLWEIKKCTTNQLYDLNKVRESLEDLLYHEPGRRLEVEEKSRFFCEQIREKLSKSRHIIYIIERGCDICYENGAKFE